MFILSEMFMMLSILEFISFNISSVFLTACKLGLFSAGCFHVLARERYHERKVRTPYGRTPHESVGAVGFYAATEQCNRKYTAER